MGEEPGAVAMKDVGEEGLGVAAGDAGGGFEECVAESHGLRASIAVVVAMERIEVRILSGIGQPEL
jgi:hypothetical protein